MSDTFNHEADAWDSLNDEWEGGSYYHPKSVKCKRCGEAGLKWKQHPSGKWWLSKYVKGEGMEWHKCLFYNVMQNAVVLVKKRNL